MMTEPQGESVLVPLALLYEIDSIASYIVHRVGTAYELNQSEVDDLDRVSRQVRRITNKAEGK